MKEYIVQVCVQFDESQTPYPPESVIEHVLLSALRRAQGEKFQHDWPEEGVNVRILSIRTVKEDG